MIDLYQRKKAIRTNYRTYALPLYRAFQTHPKSPEGGKCGGCGGRGKEVDFAVNALAPKASPPSPPSPHSALFVPPLYIDLVGVNGR